MAEGRLELKANEVCDVVEAYTGDTTANAALAHVKAGLQRFLTGLDPRDGTVHLWSFLQPIATVVLWASSTSTLDGAPVYSSPSSTVTVDDAIFYDTMVGKSLTIGSNTYTITSVTSTTICVVTGDASGEADEEDVSITANGIYRMPDAFGGLQENPVYEYHATYPRYDIAEQTPEWIFAYWRGTETTGGPRNFALAWEAYVTSASQKCNMIVAPVPDYTRTWRYRYRTLALDITDNEVYFPGGPVHNYTIRQCRLADAEILTGRTAGVMEQLASTHLARSIDHDKILASTEGAERMQE